MKLTKEEGTWFFNLNVAVGIWLALMPAILASFTPAEERSMLLFGVVIAALGFAPKFGKNGRMLASLNILVGLLLIGFALVSNIGSYYNWLAPMGAQVPMGSSIFTGVVVVILSLFGTYFTNFGHDAPESKHPVHAGH